MALIRPPALLLAPHHGGGSGLATTIRLPQPSASTSSESIDTLWAAPDILTSDGATRRARQGSRMVVIAAGDSDEHRFDLEIGRIRKESSRTLAVHLVGEHGRDQTAWEMLVGEITRARHPQTSWSSALRLASLRRLRDCGVQRIIAVKGDVNDDCACEFATSFYRRLRADPIVRAFDSAATSIWSRWGIPTVSWPPAMQHLGTHPGPSASGESPDALRVFLPRRLRAGQAVSRRSSSSMTGARVAHCFGKVLRILRSVSIPRPRPGVSSRAAAADAHARSGSPKATDASVRVS